MHGLFISHSSLDKPFVSRLAGDLTNRGFPVWLDKWEITLGDPLSKKINDGIENSFFLIIIISKNSLDSKWVKKEIKKALDIEETIKRKFLIPIKIDDIKVPIFLRDKIFIKFKPSSYLKNLSELDAFLRTWSIQNIKVPENKSLFCLYFNKYIDLDTVPLLKRVSDLDLYNHKANIQPNQIVVYTEPMYQILKDRLYERITNIVTDPYYSNDLLNFLQYTLTSVEKSELKLIEGICSLLNNVWRNSFELMEALYWFSKIIRSRIMWELYRCQIPKVNNPELIEFPENERNMWFWGALISDKDAENFYAVSNMGRFFVGDEGLGYGSGADFSFWYSEDDYKIKEFIDNLYIPTLITYLIDSENISKFIIPQMLANDKKQIWDFSNKVLAYS